ncbi:MAG: SLBB domain-containing protein [Pirellulales bacterium]
MTSHTQPSPSSTLGLIALAMVLVCLVAGGCARGRLYRATELPPDLLAPPVENVRNVDLSRLATASVSSSLIELGDVLQVSIESGFAEDKASSLPVRVGEDGIANVPLIGRLPLAGLELVGAEQAIAVAAVGRNIYRNPTVTVVMKQKRVNKVTVVGAVENPGVYELPRSSSSLLAAIVAAGGLGEEAGTSVQIRRSAAVLPPQRLPTDPVTPAAFRQPAPLVRPVSYHIDLIEATKQDRVEDHHLQDGDVVMVQRHEPQSVDVIGLVSKPGRFELPTNNELYLLDALALAGGASTQWADKVHVTREFAGQSEPAVIVVSIKEAKRHGKGNLHLGPGDIVSVEATPATLITDSIRVMAPYSIAAFIPFIW